MIALHHRLASMVAIAMLAGCTTPGGAKPEPVPSPAPEQPAPEQSQGASCGADKLAGFLGMKATPERMAKIKAASGAQTIRVVGPDDVMTMDYRVDRLTVSTTADGRIKQFRCV